MTTRSASRTPASTDDESLPDVTDLANYIGGRPRGAFRRLEKDTEETENDLRNQDLSTINLQELNEVVKNLQQPSGSGLFPTRVGGRAGENPKTIKLLRDNITDEEARNSIVFQRGIIVPRERRGGKIRPKLFKDMNDPDYFSKTECSEILNTTLKSLQRLKGPIGKDWVRSFKTDGNFILLTEKVNEWASYGSEDNGRIVREPLCKLFKLPESLEERPQLTQLQLHYLTLALSCLRVPLPSWVNVEDTFDSVHLHRPGHLIYQGGHRHKRK